VTEESGRTGALLEQLGTRFDLVIEAVSGFGGRLDSLREELRGQFTEIGRQIRFISEQIAINRANLAGVKQDLTVEIVRLGEELGKTRIEFGERMTSVEARLRQEINAAQEALKAESATIRERHVRELSASAAKLKAGLSDSGAAVAKKVESELKRANKALAALDKKFDRFDDRITIQTRDQEERVRKIERRSRG
jgi:aldehyde:ferredoxin oxidoreductase